MRGARELLLLATAYVGYTVSRHFAESKPGAAAERARDLLHFESVWRLDWERAANRLFVDVEWLGIASDFWYASTHYIVTPIALIWLYRKGRDAYVPARTALLIATLLGLAFYLLMPTAPPRLVGGYVDVMTLHSDIGWWSTAASAPKGLGDLTNQFAAFPSLHCGWALWVGLAVHRGTRNRVLHIAGYAYAAGTAFVVVGTANHWTIDVFAGWAVVGLAWWFAVRGRSLIGTPATTSTEAAPEPGRPRGDLDLLP